MAIELAPDYYLHNFNELIEHVFSVYSDLLLPRELLFFYHFNALNEDAKKLYVRMLTRKGRVFRASKLSHYTEIVDSARSALALEQHNFITVDPNVAFVEINALFNRREWLDIAKAGGVETLPLKQLSRRELDTELTKLFDDGKKAIVLDERLYGLLKQDSFATYTLLFFGNLHQNLTEFVLRDMEIYRYAKVKIDNSTRLFQSRAQIDAHLDYYAAADRLDDVLGYSSETLWNFYLTLPSGFDGDAALTRRLSRLSFKLARELERREAYHQAAEIYRNTHSPEARERLTRVYAKQANVNEVLDLCTSIISAPLSEAEEVFARDFAPRFAKKHGQKWSTKDKYQPRCETLFLPAATHVERATAAHFSEYGTCFYSENAIFCAFFGLFYWDVIFFPYRGAFTHPFQIGPHDIYDSHFLGVRKDALGNSFPKFLSCEELKEKILVCWKKHRYTASSFVYWNALNEEIIHYFCDTIPHEHWQRIFKRMWLDLKANRNGFPDLCFFPTGGGYELIEVKGPGDRLQKNQLRWMAYFSEHNIPHKVINVEWQS